MFFEVNLYILYIDVYLNIWNVFYNFKEFIYYILYKDVYLNVF